MESVESAPGVLFSETPVDGNSGPVPLGSVGLGGVAWPGALLIRGFVGYGCDSGSRRRWKGSTSGGSIPVFPWPIKAMLERGLFCHYEFHQWAIRLFRTNQSPIQRLNFRWPSLLRLYDWSRSLYFPDSASSTVGGKSSSVG